MSGGLDSYACALLFKSQGLSVRAFFIDYGQAAAKHEKNSARQIASELDIPICEITVASDYAFGAGEVVGRNLFLISAAIFLGKVGNGILGIGIHAGTPYADCSNTFFTAANTAVSLQTNEQVSLIAPFLEWSKFQIFQYLQAQGASLDRTYSCESGTSPPCGSCASCRDREALGC